MFQCQKCSSVNFECNSAYVLWKCPHMHTLAWGCTSKDSICSVEILPDLCKEKSTVTDHESVVSRSRTKNRRAGRTPSTHSPNSTETLETRPIGDGVFKLSEYVHVRSSGIQTSRSKGLGPSVLL